MNHFDIFLSARRKSFCTRLTLTRFTVLYFSFALVSCIVLVILQAVTLMSNNAGIKALSSVLSQTDPTKARDGLPVFMKNKLVLCDGIPNQSDDNACRILWGWNIISANGTISLNPRVIGETGLQATATFQVALEPLILPDNCIYSLRWLLDTLHDSRREDVVSLCFQIWLFSLAIVTLLNESIPHLAAGLFGHILGTGWAAFRVQSTARLTDIYREVIVPGLCSGQDFLGDWWGQRHARATEIIVVNICVLIALLYLSYRLLEMYAHQSFARVGASDKIRRIYKIILFFSASLQLTGFFSLASTGVWLDKINQGIVRRFTIHGKLYLAALIVTLVLLIPWIILGWVCVRRECVRRYGIFCAISVFLVTLFTLLFFSTVYRFIFVSWSFFATITVTSYICVVTSAILGVICRFNFGKGLAHYLQVNDALASANFTAGTFYDDKHDPENIFPLQRKSSSPGKALAGRTTHHLVLTRTRGSSVYSRSESGPILLSSTPPDVKNLVTDSQISLDTKITVTKEVETMEDLYPPIPSAQRHSAISRVSGASSLRLYELPERMSSLTSLRQALNEFPIPPAVHIPAVSRYALSNISQASLPQSGK